MSGPITIALSTGSECKRWKRSIHVLDITTLESKNFPPALALRLTLRGCAPIVVANDYTDGREAEASCLRSNLINPKSNAKNGIRDSAKNSGPPWV